LASQQSTVDFIVEQISGAGAISARKMFGEYAIYCDGKMVALVCDENLYVKPTSAGRALAEGCGEGSPYPGAKPHLLIDGDRWDDGEWLAALIRVSAAELPVPAKKPSRKR
jgi:TfoX/Sxy family transcriptional regulator of competence genes